MKLKGFNKKKLKKFSIIKSFINVLDIKHINNNILITICVFDKEKLFVKKNLFKSLRKVTLSIFKLKLNKINISISKLYNINKFYKSSDLFFRYKKYYSLYIKFICIKYKKLFILKKKILRLKFINNKYNVNNILGMKNILYKIYNKKVEINIINLKYIYLDSNIFTEILGSKLKDRKVTLLKTIVKSISLIKTPNIYTSFVYKRSNLDLNNIISLVNDNLLLVKDLAIIKDSMYTHIQKLSIALYNLKYKTIRGIKIKAAGRLTKRLTANRSVHKSKYKGSLKNFYSSYNSISTYMLLGYIKCNLQYIKRNYNNRNGSYGIKTTINSY